MSEKPKDSAELVVAIVERIEGRSINLVQYRDDLAAGKCAYARFEEAIALVDEHRRGLRETVKTLAEGLRRIANADPNAPEVESWKWLARKFMDEASALLQRAEEALSR